MASRKVRTREQSARTDIQRVDLVLNTTDAESPTFRARAHVRIRSSEDRQVVEFPIGESVLTAQQRTSLEDAVQALYNEALGRAGFEEE